ncbi:Orotidine 5'-phosphate decarboxylase [Podosphaera aphanis]|nr:Orotidine 5'-phosphate decarboxylase [Podosphaera aphanis]
MSQSLNPGQEVKKMSYLDRTTATSHPLSSYLLRLMDLKKSNLCLSADVSTAKQLLSLANAIGPSIVVLKTHYDLISNWDYNPRSGTGARLARIARRHGFLIFEDRKLGDIGNTVQSQYKEGTARIIEWSHITNVNMIPGKAIVDALADAAARWKISKQYEVETKISAGALESEGNLSPGFDYDHESPCSPTLDSDSQPMFSQGTRKSSIMSITTVSQHYEPAKSARLGAEFSERFKVDIEEPPMDRGLLILAQMSSKGNFMTKDYTDACVAAAREHKDFVMGFISQESLNSLPEDQFLSMTPGCQLPPTALDENAELAGDGKGQQYNTPSKIIGLMGSDIIIVGRGIINAADPVLEAERYRIEGWKAYEERISTT